VNFSTVYKNIRCSYNSFLCIILDKKDYTFGKREDITEL